MASLVDIGPVSRSIDLRGTKFTVKGLPAILVFELLKDNLAVKKMFMDRRLNEDDVQDLIMQAPVFMGQIIAAAVGEHGKEDVIDFAIKELTAGEQAEVLEATLALSFPKGVMSFISTITALVGGSETNGSPASIGKAAATK